MKTIKVAQIALTVLMVFIAVLLLKEHRAFGYVMVVLALISFISVFSKYPIRRK